MDEETTLMVDGVQPNEMADNLYEMKAKAEAGVQRATELLKTRPELLTFIVFMQMYWQNMAAQLIFLTKDLHIMNYLGEDQIPEYAEKLMGAWVQKIEASKKKMGKASPGLKKYTWEHFGSGGSA